MFVAANEHPANPARFVDRSAFLFAYPSHYCYMFLHQLYLLCPARRFHQIATARVLLTPHQPWIGFTNHHWATARWTGGTSDQDTGRDQLTNVLEA